MVGKNNFRNHMAKKGSQAQRFTIRKVSVGVASVSLGAMLLIPNSTLNVNAEEVDAASANENVELVEPLVADEELETPMQEEQVAEEEVEQTEETTVEEPAVEEPAVAPTVEPATLSDAPAAPVLNEVGNFADVVTGTAEAGSTVTVTYGDGVTDVVQADEDGNFESTVPAAGLTIGQTISAVAEDAAGNVSEAGTITVFDDRVPRIQNYGDGQNVDFGEALNPIVLENLIDDVTYSFSYSDSFSTPYDTYDGLPEGLTFDPETNTISGTPVIDPARYEDGANVQYANIQVIATNPANGRTDDYQIQISVNRPADTEAPAAPVLNEVGNFADVVTGTAEAGSTVTVTYGDGVTDVVTADDNGNFESTVPAAGLTIGQTISAVAEDAAGNVSEAGTITVFDDRVPRIQNYGDGQNVDFGEALNPIVLENLIDDVTYSFSYSDEFGRPYDKYEGLPEGLTFDPETNTISGTPVIDPARYEDGANVQYANIQVIATNSANGRTDDYQIQISVNRPADTEAPAAPVLNEVGNFADVVTGTAEAGSTVTVTYGNDVTDVVTADDNGNFESNVPASGLTIGQTISAVAEDAAGNFSEAGTITVFDDRVPRIQNYGDGQNVDFGEALNPIVLENLVNDVTYSFSYSDEFGSPYDKYEGLPEGLTFDPETNTISGTPVIDPARYEDGANVQYANIQVIATNSANGRTDDYQIQISVNRPEAPAAIDLENSDYILARLGSYGNRYYRNTITLVDENGNPVVGLTADDFNIENYGGIANFEADGNEYILDTYYAGELRPAHSLTIDENGIIQINIEEEDEEAPIENTYSLGLEIRGLDGRRTTEVQVVVTNAEGAVFEGSYNEYGQWLTNEELPEGEYTITLNTPDGTFAQINDTVSTQSAVPTDQPNVFTISVNAETQGNLSSVYGAFQLVEEDEETPGEDDDRLDELEERLNELERQLQEQAERQRELEEELARLRQELADLQAQLDRANEEIAALEERVANLEAQLADQDDSDDNDDSRPGNGDQQPGDGNDQTPGDDDDQPDRDDNDQRPGGSDDSDDSDDPRDPVDPQDSDQADDADAQALPKTGAASSAPLLLAGAASILSGLGLALNKKSKKEEDEE